MNRNEFEYYDVGGAPVVFSTGHKRPVNPLRRPQVRYGKMAASVIGLAVLFATVFFVSGFVESAGTRERILLGLAALVVYALILSKRGGNLACASLSEQGVGCDQASVCVHPQLFRVYDFGS